jgi:hypothetical protein
LCFSYPKYFAHGSIIPATKVLMERFCGLLDTDRMIEIKG